MFKRKGLATFGTDVWPLAGVTSHVSGQVMFHQKRFSALFAPVRTSFGYLNTTNNKIVNDWLGRY